MADESGQPLRALFAKFFVQWDTNGFNAGVRAVDGLFGKLQQLGQALVGGAIVGGMVALTRSVIHQGDELATTADRLGIATGSLQEWQYAADLSDVSTEEMNAGLRILQRNLFEAANGGKEAAESFAKLGVHVKDANGETISTEGAIEEIADRFKEMTNPVEKSALAMKVFGRGGQALVPLLSRGREGIKELREEFQALGGGLSEETVEAANQADDAFKRLRLGTRSLILNAMTPFIKLATAGATKLKEWIVQFRQWSKGSDITKAALIALTVVAVASAAQIVIAWLPIIATTLAWTAALTGAILIIDDLIGLFTGSKSVIGDWIDQAFGEGSAQEVVKTVKGWWEQLKAVFAEAREVGKGDFFKDMQARLNDIAEIVKAIVAGIRYLNSIRTGKSDLGKTWLGKAASLIGLDERTTNDGGAGASGLGGPGSKPLEVSGAALTKSQESVAAPTVFGLGEGGSFFSGTGLSTPVNGPSLFANPTVPIGAAAPAVNAPARGSDEAKVNQILNLTVAPESKPDPNLVPMVKKAVDDANAQMLRDLAAGQ